ncbi:MAG TPA: LuxR C-terminal-related transcriptional regulator [Candidatus Limnocylindria bacterium]|nr:LuxR C-terminal-related transcriptional regulator [Candidatus Limnocylindria bacterium]
MRALPDLRDPYAVVLAVVAAVGLLVAQEGPLVALLAAASVLVFRAVAGAAIERWRPARPEPSPESPPPAPVVPPGRPWYHPLTLRESEVALLVAQGLTNKQIASALHSERTVDGHLTDRGVDSHVQHIMDKLSMELQIDVNRRAQISAWVTERRPRGPASTSLPR